MNPTTCEKEEQTSAAVRAGTIDADIATHAQQCPVCSDILLVSEFLHDEDACVHQERVALPDAATVWRKAKLRANQEAIRLALRPIRYMKIIAVVAFICSPWLRLLLPTLNRLVGSWSTTFDWNLAVVSTIWPVVANESTIVLASSATIILLGLSSWYMLRQE